ncbi:MAG: NADH-quinone oxidoreductase subunit NuoG [Zoogloeaceae bacterium]|jgi:NADH-quinone oxidoreductase subunit G|nr:NADH-quinone oxidoreductase subunit NuoG [Zoogloeaceae bacterium]
MLEIEIDGRKTSVREGSTVMDAAQQMNVYIPHFCYHKKLSVAANCRMCLVEVEKAPKPIPACATPVTNGMRVFTHSPLALAAQKSVLEFLLINHPLDCPVCDQGGECLLQDIAVGYGEDSGRCREKKREVAPKEAGALISMREMSRCIHCSRCVRFGQEIAGVMELGMTGRGRHAEITTFLGQSVDSELSGNMIDLCPVGALTSKPFRYTARCWELARRQTISPHDSAGANLVAQVKDGKVLRMLPRENEAVNECWITDKDRFSYPALSSPERLARPMLKQGGVWREALWSEALDYVAHGLKSITAEAGGDAAAALAAPHSTTEELFLLKKIFSRLGSRNVDCRLRQQDFSLDGQRAGASWLGMTLSELRHVDSALIAGSFLRKDHPLMAQRLRHAVQKHGAQISVLSVAADDLRIPLFARETVAPSRLVFALAAVLKAVLEEKAIAPQDQEGLAAVTVSGAARKMAESLLKGENAVILLGQAAEQSADFGVMHRLSARLAEASGARLGFLGAAANSVGAELLGFGGEANTDSRQMLVTPRRAYVLFGVEPELDAYDPRLALRALRSANMVALFTSFRHEAAMEYADALLPLAPFTETSGTLINAEGRIQRFSGVAPPLGDARPGWKILSALGSLLGFADCNFEDSAAVWRAAGIVSRGDAPEFAAGLDNGLRAAPVVLRKRASEERGLERVADVPIYFTDPIARRSAPLRQTADAAPPAARMAGATLARLGLQAEDAVRVRQGDGELAGEANLRAVLDARVPEGCVLISAGHAASASLGGMFDPVFVERA